MAKAKAKARRTTKAAARPAARRKTAARAAARAKTPARPRGKQRFTVSHRSEADFDGGLRRYAKYRDLGSAQRPTGSSRHTSSNSCRRAGRRRFPNCTITTSNFRWFTCSGARSKPSLKGRAPSRCARARAGSSRRASGTRCSTIPTTARCWKSFCRRTSRPWSSNNPPYHGTPRQWAAVASGALAATCWGVPGASVPPTPIVAWHSPGRPPVVQVDRGAILSALEG